MADAIHSTNSSATPNGAEGQTVSAAERMLHMLSTAAASAAGDGFDAATWTPGMGDVPRPHGLFTMALLGDLWPTESESSLKDTAGGLKGRAERHADAATAAKANTERVFNSEWTDGVGAEAAYAHYQSEHQVHYALHTALDAAGKGTATIADSVGKAKLNMRTAHDAAHQEIEDALRATPAGGIVNVAPILAKYRTQIQSYSTELHTIVGDELGLFGASHNVPPLAPSGTGSDANGHTTDGDNSRHPDKSTSQGGKGDQAESDKHAGNKGTAPQPDQGGGARDPDQSTSNSTSTGDSGQSAAPPGSRNPDGSSGSSLGDKKPGDMQMVPTTAAGNVAGRAPDPSTVSGAAKSTVPQLPSLPSTGGGASSSPLSGAASSGAGPLTGLMGQGQLGSAGSGNLGSAAGLSNSSSLTQSAAVSAASSSVGDSMGKGIAAGTQAAGGAGAGGGGAGGGGGPAGLGQLAKAPLTPLVPPLSTASAPTSAAPASAPGAAAPLSASSAPAGSGAGAGAGVSPGVGMGGMAPAAAPMGMPAASPPPAGPPTAGGPSAPLSPYSSVLPPSSTTPTAPPAGSAPGPLASGGAATAGGGAAAAGFVPALNDSADRSNRVSRDVSMSDLELARAAVSDLAAASSVVYPVLQWAVAVARGSSGLPELWVATNEGNGFIPAGVFIPRAMALAARFDADFDFRWFGWTHPAETAVRAIRERGDTVSAVATSWPHDSDLVRELTPDFAIGVTPRGSPSDATAATLTRSRAHRLETLDTSLFLDMQRSEDMVVDSYALLVTQEAVFNAGPELPAVAQSVARGILSRQWPSEADWSALASEYEGAVLMASAQRPGLFGIEDHTQLETYHAEFMQCRRMEVLMSWRAGNVADVIYAARCAGVALPLAAVAGS